MTTAPTAWDLRPKACVFDAYGTLFDVAAAARRCAEKLGSQQAPLAALWREKQLAYSWLRTLMGAHADFRQVTEEALDFALEALALADDRDLRARLLDLYDRLDAYPDAAATLARLRRAGIRTAILSNGAPAMLASAVSHAGLDAHLEMTLSVETVGCFKPTPEVYRLATARLDLPAQDIAFVSANGWDAAGAAYFGFQAIRLARDGSPDERLPGRPRAHIESLAGLLPLFGLAESD